MAQSLSNILLHLVFSTKERQPWPKDAGVRRELHAYMAGGLHAIDCPALIINGTEDHVHILCQLARTASPAGLVEEAKKRPSKWIKSRGTQFSGFQWQAGYGAFAVSESLAPRVRTYIAEQEQHHQRTSFENEFRALCRKNRICIDERYAWD